MNSIQVDSLDENVFAMSSSVSGANPKIGFVSVPSNAMPRGGTLHDLHPAQY